MLILVQSIACIPPVADLSGRLESAHNTQK